MGDALERGGAGEVARLRNWRKHFAQEDREAALDERPRPGAAPKLDAKGEATLIALACSEAPQGQEHWTMQLPAGKIVCRQDPYGQSLPFW